MWQSGPKSQKRPPSQIRRQGFHARALGRPPQVLPPDMTELSDPSAEGLCAALTRALGRVGGVKPMEQHNRVSGGLAKSMLVAG